MQSYPPFEGSETQNDSNSYDEEEVAEKEAMEEDTNEQNNSVVSNQPEERLTSAHTSGQISASADVRTGEREGPVVIEAEGQNVAGYGNLLVAPSRPSGAVTTDADYITSSAQEKEHYHWLASTRQQYIDRAGTKRLRGG